MGLKLKGSASGESPAPASPANTTAAKPAPAHHQASPSTVNANKRKEPPYNSRPTPSQATNKRPRTDDAQPSSRKSVKFTEDTKVESATDKTAEEKTKKSPKKPKQKKTKPEPTPAAEPANIEPSLVYLRQWHTDRASWKFNKNHQTILIKYVFDQSRLPGADVPLFYSYIRDLKGFIRTRLREQAAEIKKKDMEDGAAAFTGVKEKEERDTKQKLYEEVLSKLLTLGQEDGAASDATKVTGKRSFDEAEFAVREMDDQVKQRVIKRMRAEFVLDELLDSEESTTTAGTTETTTVSASSDKEQTEIVQPVQKVPVKAGDATQPKAKRRRSRNTRTADISDSSSSESDSDSSSSDSSDDEDDAETGEANGADSTSSSSSSSSEDDSDSDSDSGSDAEPKDDDAGSDGDSEDE